MTDETNQSHHEDNDPDEQRIVSEIESTRSEMGATIDQIGHRLQPQTIADEAVTKIREATVGKVERMVDDAGMTAQRTGNTLMETVRQNPVPAALAAMGIGWLAIRMRSQASNGNGNGRGGYYPYDSYSGRYGYDDQYRQGGSSGDPMEKVRNVADNVTGTAQDVASQAAEKAQTVGTDVQRAAESAVQGAQQAVRQGQWQAESLLNDNPLAMAALALGVGAAVGLAIPETQREKELMGEQRDKLVEKAGEVATQALDQTQSKVYEVAEQVTSQA